MEELKAYTLARDGMKDLRFKGEVLSELSGLSEKTVEQIG